MRKASFVLCNVFIFLALCATPLYALGDGSSPHIDMPSTSGISNFQEETDGNSFVITFGYEHLFKKQIDNGDQAVSGEIDGGYFLLGLGYRIANQFEPYLRIGVSDLKATWSERFQDVIELDGKTDLAVGAGIKMLAYQARLTSLSRFKVGLDGQVRYTNPSIDSVVVDGVSRNVSAEDLQIFEGRVALTAGIEISLKRLLEFDDEDIGELDYYLIPYVGAVYSDGFVTAEYDDNGVQYGYSDHSYEYNLNMLAGLDLVAPDYITLNIETELFNDKSISGGMSLKF